MNILMLTTYYFPHVSGLTFYFQTLAEEYAKKGHKVTMLCSRHEPNLMKHQNINGVDVIRSKPLLKLNKGMFLPFILLDAFSALRKCDTVHLNLPALEALPVAMFAKLLQKKVVSTYVCDIYLPQIFGAKLLEKVIDFVHFLTLKISDEVVSYTSDFAKNSRVLKHFAADTREIYPAINLSENSDIIPQLQKLKSRYKYLVGMATRVAAEKGVHLAYQAIESIGDAHLVIAGNPSPVGENTYSSQIAAIAAKNPGKITLLGNLSAEQLRYFYENIDVLVVASTNSTEAFGLVQVESMLCGTPVVAVDLPGVRVPVEVTKMGQIAKINDVADLASKIKVVLQQRSEHVKTRAQIESVFNSDISVNKYLQLYA